jgi:hypothetical protein
VTADGPKSRPRVSLWAALARDPQDDVASALARPAQEAQPVKDRRIEPHLERRSVEEGVALARHRSAHEPLVPTILGTSNLAALSTSSATDTSPSMTRSSQRSAALPSLAGYPISPGRPSMAKSFCCWRPRWIAESEGSPMHAYTGYVWRKTQRTDPSLKVRIGKDELDRVPRSNESATWPCPS